MTVMVSMPMMMIMLMIMLMSVRAIVGLERCSDLGALQPVLGDERFNLRPFLQPDAVGQDLHRNMAVAECQDEPRDRREILCPHLDHRLDVGDDLGERAVVEHEKIVGAQAWRRRKIERDARALAAEHKTLLPASIVEFQQQRIDDLAKWRLAWRLACRPA
jgi:hypothetical protein